MAACALMAYHFVPVLMGAKDAEMASAVRYTCPMHPSVLSDRPGTCPICGMSLVPKEPSRAEMTAAMRPMEGVALNPAERVLANVSTAKATFHEFSQDTVAVAKVSWDERRLSKVSARIAGRVERLYVSFTGAQVEAGRPLLDIYSPDLVAAQKEYLLAIEGAEKSKDSEAPDSESMMAGLRDAARKRLKLWGLTDAQLGELVRMRQPKLTVTIFSPASGVVTERLVTAGQYVNEGTPLFSVASLSSVWVEAELYETDLGVAAIGTTAVVTADAYPGKTFRGRVTFVDPAVNPETRTLKVRIELPNPGNLLKPEMFVKAALAGRKTKTLAVPEGAVVITGSRAVTWVEASPGSFEPRTVTVGRRGDGYYEILSGLSEGETVAASGGFLIDSESQLRAAQSARDGKGH